ncbi:MAG: T9SS type A sorting domain-containing protein [candidate division KSB1 bacterium]|nr:T9SS type A sorting domain-containing protein [candidate division KSB1 bacterium]
MTTDASPADSNFFRRSFSLAQNYPNPFNSTTWIEYDLAAEARVILRIFNVRGQLVKTLVDELEKAGHYAVLWDATDSANRIVSAGIYFYRMEADGKTKSKKMTLLR